MNTSNTLIWSAVIAVFLYSYWFFKKAFRYFEERGIPNVKPKWVFGNVPDLIFFRKSAADVHTELYRKFADYKFAGFYFLHKPVIMVRDPELVKCVLTKDFQYFQEHGVTVNKDNEPLSCNMAFMKGDEWKSMRMKLTTTFTSGKMKMMFPLLVECSEKLKHVLNELSTGSIEFEAKDLCARYTTDVIASCAFGIETRSLEDPNSEFRRMGIRAFEFRFQLLIRTLLPNLPSRLINLFNLQYFPHDATNYFTSIVKNMVKYREQNHITRYDFLDLLIAMKNNTQNEKVDDQNEDEDTKKFLDNIGEKQIKKNIDMTVDLIASHCFLFFTAGFETTSSTLSFLLLELAQNQPVQTRLRLEIASVMKRYGSITYDAIKDMTYLDMVVSEILRKYPPASHLQRRCSANYKIPGTEVVIKEGTPIVIPVFAIHRDQRYYEKPEQFYPEHFTTDAKAQRHSYTYLPFGEGPRICIAERFAKMQVKVGIIYFFQNHKIKLSSRTKIPIEFECTPKLLEVKGGVWIKCKTINN